MSRTRNAAWLAFVVAVFLILRLPLSVVLAGLLPIVLLVWNGIRAPRMVAVPMWVFLLTGLLSSMVAWRLVPTLAAQRAAWGQSVAPIGSVNNASLMMVMIALTAAVTMTRHTVDVFKRLMDGIVVGLWVTLLIACFEVISGTKVLPLIYPDANTATQISSNRFLVASLFPNYNDFSVAMAMFGIILFAQLLLGAKVGPKLKLSRIAALLVLTFFIVVIGSRGALGMLMVGLVVVWITAARLSNRRLVTVPGMLMAVLAIGVGALLVMNMPFIQDHSTELRGTIITNSLAMMPPSSGYFWHGFLSMTYFRDVARELYGPILMDPHNMLLEIATMYGVPTLIAYLVAWAAVVGRGLWRLRIAPGWREVSAVVITALLPLLGIVPSSTLRYYWVYLFLAAAVAAFQIDESRRAGRQP